MSGKNRSFLRNFSVFNDGVFCACVPDATEMEEVRDGLFLCPLCHLAIWAPICEPGSDPRESQISAKHREEHGIARFVPENQWVDSTRDQREWAAIDAVEKIAQAIHLGTQGLGYAISGIAEQSERSESFARLRGENGSGMGAGCQWVRVQSGEFFNLAKAHAIHVFPSDDGTEHSVDAVGDECARLFTLWKGPPKKAQGILWIISQAFFEGKYIDISEIADPNAV